MNATSAIRQRHRTIFASKPRPVTLTPITFPSGRSLTRLCAFDAWKGTPPWLQPHPCALDSRQVLGDGLAVVVSWIGAWYPLDTLIYYTRPYRRTRRVLQALSRMEIVVQPTP